MTANPSETAVRWGVRAHVLGYVVGNLAQVVLWWLLTPDMFFWPLYSLLGWGIGLGFHVWAVSTRSTVTRRAGRLQHQRSRSE